MRNKKAFNKAGMLVSVLLVPAFVFLFLIYFGENEFDLPYKFPIGHVSESGEWQDFIKVTGDEYQLEYFSTHQKDVVGDTVYLKAPSVINGSISRVRIINVKGQNNDSNINYELDRLSDKLKNIDGVALLDLSKENMTAGWKSQLSFLESYIGTQFDISANGVIFLVDTNGFFRGVYNPFLKSEFDRLITEYQILLNF